LRWNRQAAQVAIAQHRFDACVMGGIATVIQSSQLALTLPAATAVPAGAASVSATGDFTKYRESFATSTERG
jgi:hypothetical protein